MQTMQDVIPSTSPLSSGIMPAALLAGSLGSGEGFELPELVVAPAVTYHQHRACSALVRRMYAWRGYRTSPARQLIEDPNHATLGVWLEGELVATLTASRDSSAGLLADNLYAEELSGLRKPSRVLCEVTRLAVDVDAHDPELLKSLFRSSYQYARAVFGVTDAVIEVNPRHAAYYRREFGFSQIGTVRTCPRVDAPAVLLHRPLGSLHF
ncbi:N-acyl amino acid synthase FeeM domain-containing protein [Ferribacterium limneticum]|uniref:N-acyl amino acid synthase FeeM domain-containing protein n=1 Tax=Ferribacterium limneticum TaxID=76259 RepID=UPI001CFA3980|nr:hypothetical protein [Ferribacterium limneticum]UCV17626.1 hypothetical protein KI610_12410 [Ferribacterium limneticum]